MKLTIECKNIPELATVAQQILEKHKGKKIFAFYGEMGTGKTTLIKAILKHMGVDDIVSSPSFALVNEYNSAVFGKIYHFDFYRIKNLSEVFDIGYEHYFYSNNYCFIEWPEKINSLLPDDFVSLNIVERNGIRRIVF